MLPVELLLVYQISASGRKCGVVRGVGNEDFAEAEIKERNAEKRL